MFKVVRETEKYRHTRLLETEKTEITFVECKEDRWLDKIKIVKFSDVLTIDVLTVSEEMNIFRYEDEQLLEQMVKMYKEQEVK